MRWSLALGFAALLTGCATERNYDQLLNSWLDASEAELVSAWGRPTEVFELPRGGRVLQYGHVTDTIGRFGFVWLGTGLNVQTDPNSSKQYVAQAIHFSGTGYFCETRFTVDPTGQVSHWQSSGSACITQ